jgi:hypothetical protein
LNICNNNPVSRAVPSWDRRGFLAASGMWIGGAVAAVGRQRYANQYHLHAALAAKFSAYFTSWPAGAGGQKSVMCVVTRDREIYADFVERLSGRTIGGRKWQVVQARSVTEALGHSFVYIDAERPHPDELWYSRAVQHGVLTVAEKMDSRSRNCVIEIDSAEGRPRFDIDLGAARKAGIRLHSDLL